MNEKINLSSTHRGVNHPSRVRVLPDMPSSDVVAVCEHTKDKVILLCRFHLSFLNVLDLEWHDFPPPL